METRISNPLAAENADLRFQLTRLKQEYASFQTLVSCIREDRADCVVIKLKKAKTCKDWTWREIFELSLQDYRG